MTGGYKFTKSPEKINDLIHTDVIKIFAQNGKNKNPDTNYKNIQPGYTNGIWH